MYTAEERFQDAARLLADITPRPNRYQSKWQRKQQAQRTRREKIANFCAGVIIAAAWAASICVTAAMLFIAATD